MAERSSAPGTGAWTSSAPALRDGSRWRQLGLIAALAAFLLVFAAAGGALAIAWVSNGITRLTSPNLVPHAPPEPQTSFVYDASGHVLAKLHAGVNRTIVPLSEIAPSLRAAVVDVEDRNFYQEGAVSLRGTLRAAWVDLTHHRILQGGSTITQQYVKLVFTSGADDFRRKIQETILAERLARRLTKDQILERYLNTVYFGHGAYGAQAAAETYWGIPASKLSTVQSATLAGLIQAPSADDPALHPARARARRNEVLAAMVVQGDLGAPEAAVLAAQPVRVHVAPVRYTQAAYFTSYVTQQLVARLGYQATFTGGLRVTTTLRPRLQRDAERVVAAHLSHRRDPSAALVAIDPRSGAIVAMVGGRNYRTVQFNLATQAHRQAGSAFKPFTLVAALEQGISLSSRWYGPPTITIPDPRCATAGGPWRPSNYADEAAGVMTLEQATWYSVNTIYAQLVSRVGPAFVADVAHTMGIRSPLQPVCSITLGSQAVTPLEMTDAYATLAADGLSHPPVAIARVTSPSGRVLLQPDTSGVLAVDPNIAALATSALRGVILRGTGVAANIGRPAAGKTGTSENFQDAWFCGYTPQLATCVWVGYPRGEIPMRNVEGVPDVVGGSIPAAIWHDFMAFATRGLPARGFPAGHPIPLPPRPPPPPPSPSPSHSPSPSPSPSPSSSPSGSPTPSPSPSHSPSPSPSPSAPPTPSPSGSAPAGAPTPTRAPGARRPTISSLPAVLPPEPRTVRRPIRRG